MMHQIYTIIITFFIIYSRKYGAGDYLCPALNPFFGTKTNYEVVRGEISKHKDCEVKKLWMFTSNGASYPKIDDIILFSEMDAVRDHIVKNSDAYHSVELCETDVNLFRSWEWNVTTDQAETLSITGSEELKGIGKRLLKYFPDILNVPSTKIDIRITSNSITNQSANAMLECLPDMTLKSDFHYEINDNLLMNEKNCTAWKESLKNEELEEEKKSFHRSSLSKRLLKELRNRLGDLITPKFEEVESIYDLCSYETSWKPSERSPWCGVFMEKHAQLLEFYKDLVFYYTSGYGNSLTEKLGCGLLKDMMDTFNNTENKDYNATLNFGDSLGIRKLIVALGIANEDPPLEGNGYHNFIHRHWRTSTLNPFAGNILGVLYNCSEGLIDSNETLQVGVYLNEKLVQLPFCSGQELCSYSDFLKHISLITDPSICNLDFCDTNSSSIN